MGTSSRRRRDARDRNLVLRGRTWYYKRILEGRPVKLSLETSDVREARARRDAYEATHGIGGARFVGPHPLDVPTFREASERYLDEDTSHLAPTTRGEREFKLRSKVLAPLGDCRIDEIRAAHLREWWNREILEAKRSAATGKLYLDAIGAVLAYHRELDLLPEGGHAVDVLRRSLRRRSGTKASRAASDPSRYKRPVEDPKALDRLLDAARARGALPHLVALLGLDAGLRFGEILALRWSCVVWGDDANDLRRALHIRESRSKGLEADVPKSGRERTVDLSRRLRSALLRHRGRFTPRPEAFVVGDLSPGNFRSREWRRVLEKADVGSVHVKDLRDTYASALLSMGVQLGYVSTQLGHADVSITARHYAQWLRPAGYRPPATLRRGEHPTDLIARAWPKWGAEPHTRRGRSTQQSTHPRLKGAKKQSDSGELVHLTDERRRRRPAVRADS